MSHFATGVTVVTTVLDGEPYGMTVSAFCSVSLDPLLVLVCIDRSASLHDPLQQSRRFAASFLNEDQAALSRHFARSDRPRGADGFQPTPYRAGETGCPILDDAIAFVDCELEAVYPGGDHSIFVGRVVAAGVRDGERPLLYWHSGYHRLAPPESA